MKPVRYIVAAIGFLLVWVCVAAFFTLIFDALFQPTGGRTIIDRITFVCTYLPATILGLLAAIHSFQASVRDPKIKNESHDRNA